MTRRTALVSRRDFPTLWGRGGQTTSEYALLIGLLAAATLMGMSTYVRRGLQAKQRNAVDSALQGISAPTQYEPYYTSSTSIERTSDDTSFSYERGTVTMATNNAESVLESGATRSEADLRADDAWR